jgi:hypothetical protein
MQNRLKTTYYGGKLQAESVGKYRYLTVVEKNEEEFTALTFSSKHKTRCVGAILRGATIRKGM